MIHTAVETYNGLLVKREDACFQYPAPPFSKCRGIVKYLTKLKEKGVTVVGYTETAISAAGWGVAWACQDLNMTAVIFDPQYSVSPETLLYHREQWDKFNAVIFPIPAGRAKVGWYQSKKILKEKFGPKAVLLPLGLPFKDTIEETEKELYYTIEKYPYIKNIVVCVGSGTVTAGIYRGLTQSHSSIHLYGIMCREGGAENRKRIIERKASVLNVGFFRPTSELTIIDPGYEYTDKVDFDCPFPCNPYYDLKAYKYLMENRAKFEGKTLFWNIGA